MVFDGEVLHEGRVVGRNWLTVMEPCGEFDVGVEHSAEVHGGFGAGAATVDDDIASECGAQVADQ